MLIRYVSGSVCRVFVDIKNNNSAHFYLLSKFHVPLVKFTSKLILLDSKLNCNNLLKEMMVRATPFKSKVMYIMTCKNIFVTFLIGFYITSIVTVKDNNDDDYDDDDQLHH